MTAANNDASPMDGAPVIDFDKFKPTRSFTSARKRKDFAMKALISCAFIVALIPLFSVLLTTIINGVVRMKDRELVDIDKEAVLAHCREEAADLWQRINAGR